MPAEPTKAKLKRRTSRKDLEEYRFDGSHGRELELKRNRGSVSCAECRRLKIKCDKQIPCQSCQRRGCAALCPNGSLATGQGTRFVLAATEHLHRRIANLSGRIRLLEDALALLHAKHSTEPHPLLHEDLIQTDERDGEVEGGGEDVAGPVAQSGDVLDAFGTLSISEHGISRFFGPTGGSESLLLANLDSNHASPDGGHSPDSMPGSKSPSTIGDLSLFCQSFPFTPMGQPADVQELIESHLPTYERTIALCETYFAQVSWIFRGVTRMQLMDEMIPVIYKRPHAPLDEDYSSPHDLALLFVILAVGALVGEEPSNALGEHFHQISRAAISLQPVLEKPSIVTIQALHLMSIYNAMSGSDLKSETSMEMTWSLITLASHLSQTIGLHRDSVHWGLSAKMVQRRRILFWDLFVADVWQSLNTGRPPSFSLAYIDCKYPQYSTEEGGLGAAFDDWQCRFSAEIVADVAARTLTAEAPSYTTIMELDRKVREFSLPAAISSSSDDLAASFQRCVLDHARETILMYIHRSFFAQAIIEHPVNPLKSVYAPSFLAAYRASSTILKSIREQFNVWPNSCSRFWVMWTFAFSAAVVFGTVVTRGPRSPLAQSAMAELETAIILFSKASVYSIRALKALPILTKLGEKARHALAAAQHDSSAAEDATGLLWNIKQEDKSDDELSIFAGHTRFVSAKRSEAPTSASSQTSRFEPSPPLYPVVLSQAPRASTERLPADPGPSMPQQQLPHPLSRTHSIVPPSNYNHQVQSIALSNSSSSSSSGPMASGSSMRLSMYQQHQPQQTHQRTQQAQPALQPQQYHIHAAHGAPAELQPPHPHAHYASQYPSQTGLPDNGPSASSSRRQSMSQNAPYQMYDGTAPMYQNQQAPQPQQSGAPPNMDLADLGLASRDSRLDERWGSFMADSGLLEDFRRR
ncbi:fungal-specific transcription factor domain-containing protein [Pholiota molesta]|nr:fungal-specific transcription factor domain-containing protein [Pholiota molesta]